MPARDIYHDAVKNALIRDGWIVTHDPLMLEYRRRPLFVDMAAQAPLAAEKEGRKIAIEVKSFLGTSDMVELERALGQYAMYRFLLARSEPDRTLYLALSAEAYLRTLAGPEGGDLAAMQKMNLIIFDPVQEVVTQWIDQESES